MKFGLKFALKIWVHYAWLTRAGLKNVWLKNQGENIRVKTFLVEKFGLIKFYRKIRPKNWLKNKKNA